MIKAQDILQYLQEAKQYNYLPSLIEKDIEKMLETIHNDAYQQGYIDGQEQLNSNVCDYLHDCLDNYDPRDYM